MRRNLFVIGLITVSFGLLAACTSPKALANKLIQVGDAIAPQPTAAFAPTADIVQLANAATMTPKALAIFYATNPEIDTDRATFDQHCQTPVSSRTVELGCYTSDNRIFILKISQPQLAEQMVVTAAHEMLHAAYAQLPASTVASLTPLLEAEVAGLHSAELNAELRQYSITEPGQRENELHSIIGTEYAPLDPRLEQYYSQYFVRRATVVADAQQFKQVFSGLENTLRTLQAQIGALRLQMRADQRQHKVAAYNALVPKYNALVSSYNQTVAEYNSLSRSLMGQESPAGTQ